MSKPWDECPKCGFHESTIELDRNGPWSIEQTCNRCGHISPNMHFTAEPEPETQVGPEKF